MSEYPELEHRIANKGQALHAETYQAQHDLLSHEEENDGIKAVWGGRQESLRQNPVMFYAESQRNIQASPYGKVRNPFYCQHEHNEHESHQAAIDLDLELDQTDKSYFQGPVAQPSSSLSRTRFPPRLASPISWNDNRIRSSSAQNSSLNYLKLPRASAQNQELKGLKDSNGSPISMSEYVFYQISSQQDSPRTPQQQKSQPVPLENGSYICSQVQVPPNLIPPVDSVRRSSENNLCGDRIYSSSPCLIDISRPSSHYAVQDPSGSLQPPSTPIRRSNAAAPTPAQEPKFTFMDKWLRRRQIRRTSDSNVKYSGVIRGLPTNGIIFRERTSRHVVRNTFFIKEQGLKESFLIGSGTYSTTTDSLSSGSFQSPICLDSPCTTPIKSTPIKARISALPPTKPHQKQQRKPAKPSEPVTRSKETNPELTRQLLAAASITKRELTIYQEDLQRAIFGEVLGSEDEDERKERDLQVKRTQRLLEKERKEEETLRVLEDKATKEREKQELAKQVAEQKRLQREREEQAKKAKREEVRKRLAVEEEFAKEQRREDAAKRILESRAREAADKQAKDSEKKRLAAVQCEEDALHVIECRKADAREQATSIRQYSLNRADSGPSLEKPTPVDNPLFLDNSVGKPKDHSGRNTIETIPEAGKQWRGRSKLQEEREEFERDMSLRRVQTSRNMMAELYPKNSEDGKKSKKRPSSKSKSVPRKKPRTDARVLAMDKNEDGDDQGGPSLSLKDSPYSGRKPKARPKPRNKKQTINRNSSISSFEAPTPDDEAFKAKVVSRKVEAAIISGQPLTTELYKRFQREASAEIIQNTPAVASHFEVIKETQQAPPRQKRPGTKKIEKAQKRENMPGAVIIPPGGMFLSAAEPPTAPIPKNGAPISLEPETSVLHDPVTENLLDLKYKPKAKRKPKSLAKAESGVKGNTLTSEEMAKKEEQGRIAAACLRLEEERRDVLTIEFGYNLAPCLDHDSEESDEDEDHVLGANKDLARNLKPNQGTNTKSPVYNGNDPSEATDLLVPEVCGPVIETGSSEDQDNDLEQLLEEELLKDADNTEATLAIRTQEPLHKMNCLVIRVYKVLMTTVSPPDAKIINANKNANLSESDDDNVASGPIIHTKILKEFLSYKLANAHAERSFNTQKRKAVSRLGFSESSLKGFFFGEISFTEQTTQVTVKAETVLASNFAGYDENKMEYRYTPTVYFIMLIYVKERVDEGGQKIRETIERNVGKHCTDRQMMNNSAAEELLNFSKPVSQSIDYINHYNEVRQAVRGHRDVRNGESDGLLDVTLSVDNESLPWMMEQGYVDISIEVRKSELEGPLN